MEQAIPSPDILPMFDTLELACDLIRRRSLTPEDAGCQEVMIARLEAIGFRAERLRFGEVSNFWARRGDGTPLFAFAGHTDVVPTGPVEKWNSDPFQPQIHDGYLFGRGAADMKGSLAAMVTACERFVATYPHHRGSIGLLITSDEEGPALNGTVKVVEHLKARGETITWCLVGEPSSHLRLGDVIKNGRRGSLHGRLVLKGVQGHVAYPHLVQNPIHALGPILTAMVNEDWDRGNDFFPPTSFQVSHIHAGTGATNVVPGEVEMLFNFRFCNEVTPEGLHKRVRHIIDTHLLNEEVASGRIFQYGLDWTLSGRPFLTASGELIEAALKAIREVLSIEAKLSTSGGTSDGRFIATSGAQVIEVGPVNATIHKVDERVRVDDLDCLSRIYERIVVKLLT